MEQAKKTPLTETQTSQIEKNKKKTKAITVPPTLLYWEPVAGKQSAATAAAMQMEKWGEKKNKKHAGAKVRHAVTTITNSDVSKYLCIL